MHRRPNDRLTGTRTARTAALTALIGVMLGTAALAQFGGPPPPGGPRFGGPRGGSPGGGGPGRGMRGPRASTAATAPLPALTAGLRLTAEQQAKIARIQSTFSGQRRSMMPPPPPPGGPPPDFRAMGAAFDRMRAMEQSADASVQAVLTAQQRAALPGLLRTLDDLRTAGIPPATYGALHLTTAQTARITGMAQALQQATRQAMAAPPAGGDPRSAMRAGRDRLAAQAAAVLTPTQRAIVDKYKAAHPRPAFGEPGGPRGGGFGGPPGGPPPFERRS